MFFYKVVCTSLTHSARIITVVLKIHFGLKTQHFAKNIYNKQNICMIFFILFHIYSVVFLYRIICYVLNCGLFNVTVCFLFSQLCCSFGQIFLWVNINDFCFQALQHFSLSIFFPNPCGGLD